jgi:hypothetical protein
MEKNVNRVSIENMHVTHKTYTVSQGHVVAVEPGKVILDIQSGFPSPQKIYLNWDQGRYLRKYINSRTNPELVVSNNDQIPWLSASPDSIVPNRWHIHLNRANYVAAHYQIGDLIGIKSKHEGQAFWFMGGYDIKFENILWTHLSRGVFRYVNKITIRNYHVAKAPAIEGQVPALSTPSGGPQIGQPWDGNVKDVLVENSTFDGTGDDAIALFNVENAVVYGIAT